MQEYLLNGDWNRHISNLIFKARGKTLYIKLQKKWKSEDKLFSDCIENEENADEILTCKSCGDNNANVSVCLSVSEKINWPNSKVEYLSKHWSDLPQILSLSSGDQSKILNAWNKDDLRRKTTSKY